MRPALRTGTVVMGNSYFPKQSTILVTSCRGPGSNRFWCRRSSCNTPPRRWHRLAGRGYRGGLQVGPPAFLGSCYTTKKDCGLVKSRTGQGPPETGWHGIGHPPPLAATHRAHSGGAGEAGGPWVPGWRYRDTTGGAQASPSRPTPGRNLTLPPGPSCQSQPRPWLPSARCHQNVPRSSPFLRRKDLADEVMGTELRLPRTQQDLRPARHVASSVDGGPLLLPGASPAPAAI